jgi:hypothetical protein
MRRKNNSTSFAEKVLEDIAKSRANNHSFSNTRPSGTTTVTQTTSEVLDVLPKSLITEPSANSSQFEPFKPQINGLSLRVPDLNATARDLAATKTSKTLTKVSTKVEELPSAPQLAANPVTADLSGGKAPFSIEQFKAVLLENTVNKSHNSSVSTYLERISNLREAAFKNADPFLRDAFEVMDRSKQLAQTLSDPISFPIAEQREAIEKMDKDTIAAKDHLAKTNRMVESVPPPNSWFPLLCLGAVAIGTFTFTLVLGRFIFGPTSNSTYSGPSVPAITPTLPQPLPPQSAFTNIKEIFSIFGRYILIAKKRD